MKRDYITGISEDAIFFVGKEVEHTPAFGMKTLFVTGIQPNETIRLRAIANECNHIFFGANHSFNPTTHDYLDWKNMAFFPWENMITTFLEDNFLCSLDIPMCAVEEFNKGYLNNFDNFIPQIRVPIPNIKSWNYNTMIKIDDRDFKASNPGVWTHSLHDLKDRTKFTSWDQYTNDEIIS